MRLRMREGASPGELVVLVVSAFTVFAVTLPPGEQRQTTTLTGCIVCGEFGATDAVLNFLLFAPLGWALAAVLASAWHSITIAAIVSAVIEVLQLSIIPGRDASLGDFLMNTAGAAVGAFVQRQGEALTASTRIVAMLLLSLWCGAFISLQTIGAYAYVSRHTSSRYFGQIGRAIGTLADFPGTLQEISVNGTAIGEGAVPPFTRSQIASANVTTASAVVSPKSCPDTMSNIIRVVDDEAREILLLALHGRDVVFHVRTGADRLKLRRIRFRLRDAFGRYSECPQLVAPIQIMARHTRDASIVRVRVAERTVAERFPSSASRTWILFMPMQLDQAEPTQLALADTIWLVLIAVPIGYLVQRTLRSAPSRTHPFWPVSLALTSTLVSLHVVPLIFGVPASGLGEWSGASGGLVLGFLLARRTASTPAQQASVS